MSGRNEETFVIKQKRYEKILEIVNEMRVVSIDDFCSKLGVSKATVRRDLIYLDDNNLLKRTHGGAVSMVKPALEDVPISLRHRMFKEEKERIAQAAIDLIYDGSTIYIGAGTTMRELASRLDVFSKLTVLTNDIGVAYEISQRTSNDLILAGGVLKKPTASLVGSFTENILRDLFVETAFMSSDSVKPQTGFMDYNIDEVAIKRIMLANARRSVMLCDHSKFQNNAFMSICPLSNVDLTITDGDMDAALRKELVEDGMELQIV